MEKLSQGPGKINSVLLTVAQARKIMGLHYVPLRLSPSPSIGFTGPASEPFFFRSINTPVDLEPPHLKVRITDI